MKTKTIGTLLLATTLSFAGISYAVAGNHNKQKCNNTFTESSQCMNKGSMKHKGMGFAQLDLSDEQKQEMQTIMSSSKGKNKNRLNETERATRQAEMQALMYAETFDEEKAKALINKKQTRHSEKKLTMLKAKHQMFQLLTDEQKVQYSELKMQHNGNKTKRCNN